MRQFCTNVGLPYVRNDDSVRSKHGQDGEVAEADRHKTIGRNGTLVEEMMQNNPKM